MQAHWTGGSTFAECPDCPAPAARLLWRARLDPGVLPVRAETVRLDDTDALDLARLGRCAAYARDDGGREYLALSDGWNRIRLDVMEGSLPASGRVRLHYQLSGFAGLGARLLTVRRLHAFWRHGRFSGPLFPPPAGLTQRLEALRAADALAEGASYREIAIALFGEERVRAEWGGRSDFLLSRIRRRVAEAKRMAGGGYRDLLGF